MAEQIVQAGQPLFIAGGSSRKHVGEPVKPATDFSTAKLAGIVAYEPSELFVTAGAATTLADLDAALAQNNQQLAAEVPKPAGATLGGALATGFSGPCAPWCGQLRDHVLGITVIDGSGDILHFGGTVLKNVAGFDITRLLVGSFGTLGCIVDATLRVRGLPSADVTVAEKCDAAQGCVRANELVGRGLPIAAGAWLAGKLHLRLCGSENAVAAAADQLAGAIQPDADQAFWAALRDWTLPELADSESLWMCRLPPLAQLDFDNKGVIEWHGARRWFAGSAAPDIRRKVAAAGGSAILVRRGQDNLHEPVFPAPPPGVLDLQRKIKQVFDPRGILNPGRLSFL